MEGSILERSMSSHNAAASFQSTVAPNVPSRNRANWNSPVTSYPPGGVEVRERETQGGAGFVVVAAVGKWESRSDFQAEWKSRSLTFPRSGFSTAAGQCPAGKIAAPWPLPVAILIWCVR